VADHALMIRSDRHTTPEAGASAVDRSRMVSTKHSDLRVTVKVGDPRHQPLQDNSRGRYLRRAAPKGGSSNALAGCSIRALRGRWNELTNCGRKTKSETT
jgi:hypothetical protein